MKVWVGQVYGDAGAVFPFSHVFQIQLSEVLTALVEPSPLFVEKFGIDFELMFRMSAKGDIESTEILGPTVFRKAKDVEYTIFLPYATIMRQTDAPRQAILLLLNGIVEIFGSLQISTSRLLANRDSIVENLCSNFGVLATPSWNEAENQSDVWRAFEEFFSRDLNKGLFN